MMPETAAGAEADSFSLGVWPDLRTAGGFRQISSLWVNAIAQLVWSCNSNAAQQLRHGSDDGDDGETALGSSSSSSSSSQRRRDSSSRRTPDAGDAVAEASSVAQEDAALDDAQPQQQQQQQVIRWSHNNKVPPTYPSPCLLGSPFTTLAVTHNYHSLLHAEPREHPFSYIAWLDVLGPGSEMQVGWHACTIATLSFDAVRMIQHMYQHPFSYIAWLDVLGPGSEMQVRVRGMLNMWCDLGAIQC
jgi:hypothetical protein